MSEKHIPDFDNEEEEALFWEENSIEEFMDDLEDETMPKVSPLARTQAISLRISIHTLDKAKELAASQNVGYQSLIKKWIEDGLHKEQQSNTIQLKEFVSSAQEALQQIGVSLEEIKKRA